MKKFLKPAFLLFYLLMPVSFFFVGLLFAKLIDAGKGQMLAAGAIVLGYGVLFAGLAFVTSFIIVRYTKHRYVVIANIVLSVLLVSFLLYFRIQYKNRNSPKPAEHEMKAPKPTAPAEKGNLLVWSAIPKKKHLQNPENDMGLGFFTPNFYDNPLLYFYGNVNPEKSVMEHAPTDSIVFKRRGQGGFDIAQAPPWLVPEHMKLDYDMLYFEIAALGREFAEVVVNTQTRRTALVNKYGGKIIFWPAFLLQVHSVEFPPDSNEKVRARPFEQASEVNLPYSFLKPVSIKNEWMQVELWNDDFRPIGKGWIRWQRNGKLLIDYSLLS